MSDDELAILILCGLLGVIPWLRWGWLATQHRHLAPPAPSYLVPWTAVPLSGALLFALLSNFASSDVRGSGAYLFFYMVMGSTATALFVMALDRLGLSLRDDVIERRNPAACVTWAGALVGATLAFAGANIGDGPGWWVVVFCSAMSLGSLLLGWWLLDRVGDLGEAIVVERDAAAGLRAAGWFVACGALTGRAAAGNWVSAASAVQDFIKVGQSALVLTVLAAIVEAWLWHRSRNRPARPERWVSSVILAALWPALAFVFLVQYGAW
jgi:uncharacterized membrane protein YjfL (UPF0719 family)